jgi:hypothetical protein
VRTVRALVVALGCAVACGDAPDAGDGVGFSATGVGEGRWNIPLAGIAEPTRLVVRDQAAWAAFWTELWSRHDAQPALPEVDFGSEMVVVVGLGTRPSSGFHVDITAVRAEGADLAVSVVETRPHATCDVLWFLTQPVVLARVPRWRGTVRFVEMVAIRGCE